MAQQDTLALFTDEVLLVSSATGSVIASWQGAYESAALAQLGDLDGDGTRELGFSSLVPNSQPAQWQARVVSGATLTPTTPFLCPDPGQYLAAHIVGLSDIDGDGVDDVAASSWGFFGAPPTDPRVYFFSGATRREIRSVGGEPPTSTFPSQFGYALSSAGDHDRDGVEDVAAIDTSYWAVTVLSGRTGLRIARYPETGDFGGLGGALASPGDLNGDGLTDLLAGAALLPLGTPPTTVGRVTAIAGARELTYTYCDDGAANSTGVPTRIDAVGSTSIAAANLRLVATEMPTQSFGYFLVSDRPNPMPNPGGPPVCLGGGIGRFVGPGEIQSSGSAGRIEIPVDLTSLPVPTGPFAAQPFDTLYFQCWHRDLPTAGSSNLSNALGLVAAP
ncbi:MAG: hypothetical protein AAGI22_08600 [Planctomycetota bacterium]